MNEFYEYLTKSDGLWCTECISPIPLGTGILIEIVGGKTVGFYCMKCRLKYKNKVQNAP